MRRWVGSLALAVGAWACAIQACTGESSFYLPAVDAGAVDTDYAIACGSWAQAVCIREENCVGTDPVQWTSLGDLSAMQYCVERSTLLCEVVATDPNVSFDAQKIANCPYSTDCTAAERDLPIDCLPPGRSRPGAPCVFHEACSSGLCETTTGICGVCAAPPAPCACASNQVCLGKGLDGGVICDDASGVDGGCTLPAECIDSYCDLTTHDHGTCIPFAALGESCGDGQGASPGRVGTPCGGAHTYCDATLHCSAIEGVGYMGPCGAPADGGPLLECAGYATCDPSSSTCIQPAPDGEVCDQTQGLGCTPPAECIGDRCLYPSLSYCGL